MIHIVLQEKLLYHLTAVTTGTYCPRIYQTVKLRKHMKDGDKSMKEIIFQGKRKQLVFIVICTTLVQIPFQSGNIMENFSPRVRRAMYHQLF